MKKVLLVFGALFVCIFCFNPSFAQKVKIGNKVIDLKNEKVKYIELVAKSKMMNGKANVQVDFGQKGNGVLVNEKGEILEFNSPMHALNYLVSLGWKYKNHVGGMEGSTLTSRYLLENDKIELKEGDIKPIEGKD